MIIHVLSLNLRMLRLENGSDQVLFSPWFSWFLGFDSKTVQRSALCRSRREFSNEYSLAKFGFDTAENELDFKLIYF